MEQQNFVPGSGKTQCMGCMQFYNAEFDVCPFCGYQKDTPVKAPWHIKPGTLLVGRYVIGRVVGYGGFGVTYIAWDTMLKRRIAIKEYLPSEFATRMADEQEIMLLDGEKQLSQYQKGLDRFFRRASAWPRWATSAASSICITASRPTERPISPWSFWTAGRWRNIWRKRATLPSRRPWT